MHSPPVRNWELEGRDAKIKHAEMEASVSSEKELNLAAEAVKMTAEEDRLQAELGLRAERQHRAWRGQWVRFLDGGVCFGFFRFVLCCCFFSHNRYQESGTLRVRITCTWALARSLRAQAQARARALRTRFGGGGFAVIPRVPFRVAPCLQMTAVYTLILV